MRIPVEWMKEYVNTNKSVKDIAKSFTLLGLLLDKIDVIDGNEVLDLEHRMDRSDWLSVLGCARDFAAFEGLELKYPNVYTKKCREPAEDEKIRIQIDCPDLVKRFNTRVFKNVCVKKSPEWLSRRLKEYGIASKNNIVDITNYVMIEYGQPMHAQDINKMEKPEIVIRRARNGEEITTLLGEVVKLDTKAFVLTQNDKPTVLGGIVGGPDTAVDENTTNIVLDAGNYDQTNIRQSSRRFKIQNETVLRYDKFLHPELTQKAIERATYLILELARPEGGEVEYFENEDWYNDKPNDKIMELRLDRLLQVGGMTFEMHEVRKLLEALEYEVIEEEGTKIKVKVPYFRTDVVVEDDLIADILRLNNYETIPLTPINTAPPKEITPDIYKFEDKLRTILHGLKFHEHITDPLTNIVSHDVNNKKQIILENALTPDKSALRTSIYKTLIPVMRNYKKHKMPYAKLFEIGNIYYGNNVEERILEIIYNDFSKTTLENSKNVRAILASLMQSLGIKHYYIDKNKDNIFVIVATKKGDVNNTSIIGTLKLDSITLNTKALMMAHKIDERTINTFKQQIIEDLSVKIRSDVPFGKKFFEIQNFDPSIEKVEVINEYIDEDSLGKNNKTILLRITFNAKTKIEVEKIKNKIIENLL